MDRLALTFPYQYKRIDFGKLFNPLVLFPVKTAFGWQNLWFLVDSGADSLMLPVALARRLGLEFNPKVKTRLHGIGKQAVLASPGKITLKINHSQITARSYFVYSDDSFLLLGRLDIFEHFSVSFDKEKQAVVFTE